MKILFTICGRAGSKGFKNKHLKEMQGIPLVFYTLAAIKGYAIKHSEDEVVIALNTDSEPLVELIRNQNSLNIQYVERKEELAGDIVPKIDVIKDTFLACDNSDIDLVIDLDITSPLRRVEDIENVIAEYKNRNYDVVFSVVDARRSPYFNMVENNPDGYFRKICESKYTARQQMPKSYELNASIYAYNPEFLRRDIEKTILDYNCGISVMPDYLVLDIDSEEDLEMMQYLHKYYCTRESGLFSIYEIAKDITETQEQ